MYLYEKENYLHNTVVRINLILQKLCINYFELINKIVSFYPTYSMTLFIKTAINCEDTQRI